MTHPTPVADVTMLDGAALARRWSSEMRQLCAWHAAHLPPTVVDAPPDWDMRRGVDYVSVATIVRYAARVRNATYRHRFPDDITIRAQLPSGAPTELDKFLSGAIEAEWYLYAFVSDDDARLDAYTFCRCDALTAHLQGVGRAALEAGMRVNTDGTALVAVNVNELPAGSFERYGSLPAPLF